MVPSASTMNTAGAGSSQLLRRASWLRALRDPQIAEVLAVMHARNVIARGVGYTSEFAFSRAFTRTRGEAPARYRRAQRAAAWRLAGQPGPQN
jgi:AraC-like DNA-binding protein